MLALITLPIEANALYTATLGCLYNTLSLLAFLIDKIDEFQMIQARTKNYIFVIERRLCEIIKCLVRINLKNLI